MVLPEQLTKVSPADLETAVLAWWDEARIFEKSVEERTGKPTFSFYEGPPTANGRPGIHHVLARTIKDVFCRYKTMKGYRVERKAGWDTHGLPVEIEVEKELGLDGREEILAYGIERFNEACRKSVLAYKDEWDELTRRMAYWVDLERPYITFDNGYIESVWWLLRQLFDQGLIYRGRKIQWYSPGSGTVLSSHEVSLGYKEVQDPSVYVQLRVRGEQEVYFLVWTTTPWTLISNAALAVGPDIEYVQVRQENRSLILAASRLEVLKAEYAVERRLTGRELVGLSYEPLFDCFAREARGAWRVVAADFVSTEDGTGIVHLAPAFGADDYAAGQREGLPVFNPIDDRGRFTEKAPLVSGMWFKTADRTIVRDLRRRGRLYRQETYVHNYPHDWRKGTPLMSYPVESWFIRTTALRDRLVALNGTINWQPASIGIGRFGEWLSNNVDWALSRRRFWGTPLPIWVSDQNPDHVEMIGSVAELERKCGQSLKDLDLHRPHVDELTWAAPGGGTMRRVPETIDVWFDSGAMPFAQWHYPFEHRDAFERSFPADFIAEGVDQTRGWFYTLHAIATLVRGEVAFKNCVVNGLVLDEKGEKMSKTKGNAVDPFAVIGKYGADRVRWYLMSNSPPWEDIRFSERRIAEVDRKFFGTLANIFSFYSTYAAIDGFVITTAPVPIEERPELDRWILSRLQTTIREADTAFAAYHPTRAARSLERFVDELSNWYIRRSRRRFWSAKEKHDASVKWAAYQTVYASLLAVAKMVAPLAPFFAEWLFRSLASSPESVHLAAFPVPEKIAQDPELEKRMHLAQAVSSAALALRNQSGLNIRQPLSRLLVVTGGTAGEATVASVADIIKSEVNVKDIEYVKGSSPIVKREARPNFRRLGKRLGKHMKVVAEAIRNLDEAALDAYALGGAFTLEVDGRAFELGPGDIEIVTGGIEGWLVGQGAGVTVALDTRLSAELVDEGMAREAINRIQNLRKKAGFNVTDRIRIAFVAPDGLARALACHEAWIRNETLARELKRVYDPKGEVTGAFRIGDHSLELGLTREVAEHS